jgi:hypothetical protein
LGLFLDGRVCILEKFGERPLQFTHYIRWFRIGPLKIFVRQPRTKFSFKLIRFLNLLCILLLLTFLVRIFYLLFFGVLIAALYLTGPIHILHLLLLEIRIRPQLTAYIHDPRRLILSSTGHLFTLLRGCTSRWGLRRGFGGIPRASCYLVGRLNWVHMWLSNEIYPPLVHPLIWVLIGCVGVKTTEVGACEERKLFHRWICDCGMDLSAETLLEERTCLD